MHGFVAKLRAGAPRVRFASAAENVSPGAVMDDFDFSEVKPVEHLPGHAFPFIAFLIRTHFPWHCAAIMLTVAIATTSESLNPYFLGKIVNALTPIAKHGVSAWSTELTRLFALLAGFWVFSSLVYRVWEIIDFQTSPRLRALAQRYMFGYLLGHSHRFFQDNFAGKIGQKVKQAGQASVGLLGIVFFDVTRLIVLMVVAGSLLYQQHSLYTITLVTWAILYLGVMVFFAKRCVVYSKKLADEVSTSSGRLIDAISNADLIRAFAKSVFEKRFISRFLLREMNASRRLRWFMVGMRVYMSFANIALMVFLAFLAARDVITGTVSLGSFTMIFLMSNMIARSVQDLSYRMLDFFDQLGTLEDALDLVTRPHEIPDAKDAKPLLVDRGGIDIVQLAFHHKDGTRLFDDLNIRIKPGEKVGLVGHSGAGKSTLVKLFRRQYEPDAGTILIDGQNIAHVTADSLNETIAEVPQSAGIFHRTIRENIRYHNPRASEADVVRAAELAHAHEFISARPTGYDTIVGEQGIKLSGGERQRVAIARAFLKNAKILILDEATSSLDSESEHLIQSALFKLMEGRTVIAIAHRLSTIVGMDRILYMEAGKIMEEGSHGELVAKGGAYARLWERQVSGFIAA